MKHLALLFLFSLTLNVTQAQRVNFDADWQFAFGNAQDPQKDFGCGTEYFNYLTKAASIHNEGPYAEKFDPAKFPNEWTTVNLPHDWVVDLGFAAEASHSHGYKQVGWRWPETSVGWYRKWFVVQPEDAGRQFYLTFDGIFRNSQVWVNGFYCGGEQSGYISQEYNISDYIRHRKLREGKADSVLVCVRVDASLEEGWFYEGAGIYRHAWLEKKNPVHLLPGSQQIALIDNSGNRPQGDMISVQARVVNGSREGIRYFAEEKLIDADGRVVSSFKNHHDFDPPVEAQQNKLVVGYIFDVKDLHPWSPDDPYLYTIRTILYASHDPETPLDSIETTFGFREVKFDANKGLFINRKPVKLKGVCLHQDHAGVGAGIPDELYLYRIQQLKKLGVNAIRSSHNPMSPALLDICDSLGILVIEENRLLGTSEYQRHQLKSMIDRDRNHPSIIAWSVGNEEWGVEWNELGEQIVRSMSDYVKTLDPTRPTTVATSSGPEPIKGADLAGYNYIMQNDVENRRREFPKFKVYGSEETTGCGTRGYYFQIEGDGGHMIALNRQPEKERGDYVNRIERGWKFYAEHDWAAGCFFWTGFDYRGEPNPLGFPATGSEFGILDYCGFPKDEAFYLKAWWTDEPVLHILPHWNLKGHEGEEVDVWAYSNCDEVELFVNGKSLGRKKMKRNSHLAWKAVYQPGEVKAVGYRDGRRILTETIETTGEAVSLKTEEHVYGDITVIDIFAEDKRGRFVPDASHIINIYTEGEILGVGNGDPAWQEKERPLPGENPNEFQVRLFNGCAQVVIKNPQKWTQCVSKLHILR